MPWPVASPETISSLFYKVGTILANSLGDYDLMCENRHPTPFLRIQILTMLPSATLHATLCPLRGSDPAGDSLATLCNLEKQFNVFVEHDSHPGCGLAEANRHTLNMTAAAFP